jgi:hypothetical protein
MGGGIMQLVVKGAQDVYLTGNPQITFFKVVYRRHTNFAMECIQQTLNGNIGWGNTISSVLSKSGDLVYKMYLQWKKPWKESDTDISDHYIVPHNFGHFMIDYVSIDMGGQEIDRQTGHWMEVYSRLNFPNNDKTIGQYSREMINLSDYVPYNPHYDATVDGIYHSGNLNFNETPESLIKKDVNLRHLQPYNIQQNTPFQQMTGASGCNGCILNREDVPEILQIPLQFWFCRNPGLALPIIALQYHDVKINLKFQNQFTQSIKTDGSFDNVNSTGNILNTNSLNASAGDQPVPMLEKDLLQDNVELWCEYIFLDEQERQRFAQVSHEYLIEQVQYDEKTISSSEDSSFSLNKFNHPVKSLIFTSNWGKLTKVDNVNSDTTHRNFYPFVNTIDTRQSPPVEPFYSIPGSLPCIGDSQTTLTLKFNGNNRFDQDKPWYYFSRYQTNYYYKGPANLYSHLNILIGGEGQINYGNFTNASAFGTFSSNSNSNRVGDSIGVYSFALKPDEHQPSGTCNFSRIDDCNLKISNPTVFKPENTPQTMIVYAVNYNVLRIMSGMAGLAYSS